MSARSLESKRRELIEWRTLYSWLKYFLSGHCTQKESFWRRIARELEISSVPKAIASSRTSTQNEVSTLFDTQLMSTRN